MNTLSTPNPLVKRYKVYYRNRFDVDDNLVLYSDCYANSEQEARKSTLKYLNPDTIITKVVEVQNEKTLS